MARGVSSSLLLASVFAIILLSCELKVSCAEGVKTTTGGILSYNNFRHHLSHYLNVTKVGEYFVHNLDDCAFACLQGVSCVSFNMAAHPDVNGHILCELLASDKYNSSAQFLPHPDFHHYSISTPCSKSPCKNGGTCIPLYRLHDFKCKCLLGFCGKKCESILEPADCLELYRNGFTTSGVYPVDPDGQGNFSVYCDMNRDGGGWTVFQRRQDGSKNFYLGWSEYKAGFGQLTGEFWLGLDKIHRLTASRPSKLRVDLGDWSGHKTFAKYDSFGVGDEQSLYRLSVGSYSGTAGDSLTYHNNMKFSTKDRDHDTYGSTNCATRHDGAWWYKTCYTSNLNGRYYRNKADSRGVRWNTYKGTYSLKFSEMKLRPAN